MSADFFNDPENSVVLQICRTSPGFIPIVRGGKLDPVRERAFDVHSLPPDRSIPDYVLGLEVLGCKVSCDGDGSLAVDLPRHFRSPMWRERARQLEAGLRGISAVRHDELLRYLRGHADDVIDEVKLW